eukprot:CAMPEP_0194543584 /NCGR_PEP_ID=MMETSP0253-20130528/86054_1 /TAXON_ID=2966 /ORGANISM="Noctiluca scintillans" /LENGTH=42 /DNA_ID= /DNA_START= /DNA_END= /DNA_ORIENTATION=
MYPTHEAKAVSLALMTTGGSEQFAGVGVGEDVGLDVGLDVGT